MLIKVNSFYFSNLISSSWALETVMEHFVVTFFAHSQSWKSLYSPRLMDFLNGLRKEVNTKRSCRDQTCFLYEAVITFISAIKLGINMGSSGNWVAFGASLKWPVEKLQFLVLPRWYGLSAPGCCWSLPIIMAVWISSAFPQSFTANGPHSTHDPGEISKSSKTVIIPFISLFIHLHFGAENRLKKLKGQSSDVTSRDMLRSLSQAKKECWDRFLHDAQTSELFQGGDMDER